MGGGHDDHQEPDDHSSRCKDDEGHDVKQDQEKSNGPLPDATSEFKPTTTTTARNPLEVRAASPYVDTTGPVVGGVVALLAVIVIAVLIALWWRRRKSSKPKPDTIPNTVKNPSYHLPPLGKLLPSAHAFPRSEPSAPEMPPEGNHDFTAQFSELETDSERYGPAPAHPSNQGNRSGGDQGLSDPTPHRGRHPPTYIELLDELPQVESGDHSNRGFVGEDSGYDYSTVVRDNHIQNVYVDLYN